MNDKVYILFEGDVWLSTTSLSILAVFTTIEAKERYLRDMAASGMIDDDGLTSLLSGKSARGSWRCEQSAFLLETWDANQNLDIC